MFASVPPDAWLPEGKSSALCFTIDDVHPGTSRDAYEAGGDLGRGALGHVAWLLERHPKLNVTLFTTPDWRELSPVPTRRVLRRLPFIRDRVLLARVLPAGTMRLDRHPEFVAYLRSLPRTEVGLHGLHHIHAGEKIYQEFQAETEQECRRALREATRIFDAAKLPFVRGMTPPGWAAPPPLVSAMSNLEFDFVASARDIKTNVGADALANMSGLHGVPLVRPVLIAGGRLVHVTTNFQATNAIERALEILRCGGLLAIKAHIIKNALGFVMLDGLDEVYANYLDLLFGAIDRELGESVWWTSMGNVARRIKDWKGASASQAVRPDSSRQDAAADAARQPIV